MHASRPVVSLSRFAARPGRRRQAHLQACKLENLQYGANDGRLSDAGAARNDDRRILSHCYDGRSLLRCELNRLFFFEPGYHSFVPTRKGFAATQAYATT